MSLRHVCLCYGATWSTTCCIVLPLTPRTPYCLEPVCIDHASQMVRNASQWHAHWSQEDLELSEFSLIAFNSFKYFCSSDSFGGLQASGGRGLSLSRVSQQDLDLVRNSWQPAAHIGMSKMLLQFECCSDKTLCCANVRCACLHVWVRLYVIPCLLFVQLKSDMAAGFGEALQRKLLEVEGLYSQVRSRYTFIQALVRRVRGLLRQPKSWGKHTNTKTYQEPKYSVSYWMITSAQQLQKTKLPRSPNFVCLLFLAASLLFTALFQFLSWVLWDVNAIITYGALCVTNSNYEVWLPLRKERS